MKWIGVVVVPRQCRISMKQSQTHSSQPPKSRLVMIRYDRDQPRSTECGWEEHECEDKYGG